MNGELAVAPVDRTSLRAAPPGAARAGAAGEDGAGGAGWAGGSGSAGNEGHFDAKKRHGSAVTSRKSRSQRSRRGIRTFVLAVSRFVLGGPGLTARTEDARPAGHAQWNAPLRAERAVSTAPTTRGTASARRIRFAMARFWSLLENEVARISARPAPAERRAARSQRSPSAREYLEALKDHHETASSSRASREGSHGRHVAIRD